MKTKKIIAGMATVVALGIASAPVLASTDTAVHSGMADADENNSLLRTTQERDGGTWNYGVGSKYVWSYYQHKHRTHSSSVKPGFLSGIVDSGLYKKGKKSKASAPKAKHGNKAYYNVY